MQKENLDFALSILFASIFVLLLMVAVFLLFRIYLKRKNKLILENEKMRTQFEQTLLQSKLEIQEETFTYISRELHDNIGQALSMVKLNLNTLDLPAGNQKIELIDEILGKSIADLRSLSHSLDSDSIRINGWVNEVEKLLVNLRKTGKYKVNFFAEQELPALGKDKPIILFRMIQEVINNIIKHAGANEINFTAIHKNNNIIIEIKDNGKGFDKSAIATGSGLNNLVARSKMINTDLQINSKPGEGTKVLFSIKDEPNE